MSRPLVSVIMPAHNAAPWIGAALESVFRQTRPDYEVVVVDDGSTDDTPRVLEAFAARIRCLRQPNLGVAAARNAGIAQSRGALIAQLDADDLWLPTMLETLIPLFDDPAVGIACGDIAYWDQRSPPEDCPRHWQRVGMPDDRESLWRQLIDRNFVPAQATIIRRSVFATVGPYDEQLRYAEDYDMWLRLARTGCRFRFSGELLGVYRLRPGSLATDLGAKLDAHLRIGGKLLALPDLGTDETAEVRRRMRWRKTGYRTAAVNYMLAGQVERARAYFGKAVRYSPYDPRNLLGLALAWASPRLATAIAASTRRRSQTTSSSVIFSAPPQS